MCSRDTLCEPLLNGSPHKTSFERRVTEYATANLFNRAMFSWLSSVLNVGYKRPLDLNDLPRLAKEDSAAFVSQNFENHWIKSATKNPGMCLFLSYRKEIVINACFAGIYTCSSYVGPYLVNNFVEYLSGNRHFKYEGYILSFLFFIAKLIENLAQRQRYFGAQQLGLRVTAALSASVYRKGLCLSSQSRQRHSSGEIINYVSVDVKRVNDFTWYLHDIWLLILHICLALMILYRSVGIAVIASFGAITLIMLANIPLSTMLEKYQTGIMKAKDARMRTTAEILRSMRILKLQAWEMKFMKKIEGLRKVESEWLKGFRYSQAGIVALFWASPAIVGAITFSACLFMGVPLTAGRVLSALATFRILKDPIYGIPDLIGVFSETKVSLHRIKKFLDDEEIDVGAVSRCVTGNEKSIAVGIYDACFSWDSCTMKPTLSVHQVELMRGSKVAVCGQVGAGKSSFISCILGEISKISGTVQVNGSMAYVAQTAWIQSGKVQDNILFGKPMDRQRYDTVLAACSLIKDLDNFSHGDQTEIGERGINLSGGQKQRIQLARAVYQDADIYLLDDPFSAVDAHTGSHIFQRCVLELLKQKTVLYVTHQLEFLPAADNILVLENGAIVQAGRYEDLVMSGANFSKLIGAHLNALKSVEDVNQVETMEKDFMESDSDLQEKEREVQDHLLQLVHSNVQRDSKHYKQLVQREERETGKVDSEVYWSLATAVYGGSLVPLLLLAQILFQALQILSNYWMAWAVPVNSDERLKVSNKILLGVYLGLAAASALCIFSRSFLLAFIALKTAEKFFVNMLQSVFHAPMSFFDATPAGRVLNRASTDQSALDLDVCNRFATLIFNIIELAATFVIMSQVGWQVLGLFIPVIGFCVWLQQFYIVSARELARLVGIRRSPVIHHLSESIAGVATIRGFNQEIQFISTNMELIDCYCRPLFHNFAAMEWLCLRLNVISSCTFMFFLLLVVNLPPDRVNEGIAGLAVTYALGMSQLQYSIVLNLCHLENKIISVERILQYSCLPSEAPLVVDNNNPPTGWPWAGTIMLKNVQVRYAPHLPLVLRNITCTFLAGQKIGVVGRTGSGKSTLVQVLFRILEPEAGTVIIDDVDTSQIGLHTLRSRLSIIPQEPTLFEGTVRENFDPLMEHTDYEIWEAIKKSQLSDVISSKNEGLDSPVSENGENWSVGQRQLVCLGRALLKQTRILILDEATASVDTATDCIIQNTLQSEFTDCTVISIAHRIQTVIDSNCILLLENGMVSEFGPPQLLLRDKCSLFAKLVSEYTRRSSTPAES